MGKEIVYCELCGERILEQEFQQGRAVTILNKNYCLACKAEAIRIVGVAPSPPPAPKPPQPRAPGASSVVKSIKLGPGSTPLRPQAVAPPPPRRRSIRAEHAVLGFVGLFIIIGSVLLYTSRARNGEDPATAPPSSGPAPQDSGLALVVDLLRRRLHEGADPQLVLDECALIRPKLAGTRHLAELDQIESQARERLDAWKAEKELARLIADLRDLPAQDRSFKRYEEAQEWIGRATELVRDRLPGQAGTLEDASKRYMTLYNDEAARHYERVQRETKGHADKGRFQDAIDAAEQNFPEQFRRSSYWPNLAADIERYRALLAKNPKPPPDSSPGPDPGPAPPPRPPGPLPTENPRKFPVVEIPEIGQWTPVQDFNLWHRWRQKNEREDNWKLEDGILFGTSSYTDDAASRSNASDFLILRYPDVTDYELEFKVNVEEGALLVGGRFVIHDKKPYGVWAKLQKTSEGVTLRYIVRGREARYVVDDRPPKPLSWDPDTPDQGRLFFALFAHTKVQIRDLRFLRTK